MGNEVGPDAAAAVVGLGLAGVCAAAKMGKVKTLKSTAKTLRNRFVFIQHSPWPQELRRDLLTSKFPY
jgi:hypothetical protein